MNQNSKRMTELGRQLDEVLSEAGRHQREVRKLLRILGRGNPIYPVYLPPVGESRDEAVLARSQLEEDLHLSDDIVSILTKLPMFSIEHLCRASCDFEPIVNWNNFAKVKKSAPGILLAIQLRDAWHNWFEMTFRGDSVQLANSSELIYELVSGMVRPDFLLQKMMQEYFSDHEIDFKSLFPEPSALHMETHARLLDQLATKIARCFQSASQRGEPNRPDLTYGEEELVLRLRQELLGSANGAECARLTAQLFNGLLDPTPDLHKEVFYREQYIRHFSGGMGA